MEKNELTGIERQLVLEYLMDGNAPLTLSLQNENLPEKKSESLSVTFPVALRSEQMKVLGEGIILLRNTGSAVESFFGKNVRVQFYFNKLALYFDTRVQRASTGLALVIPSVIHKLPDEIPESRSGFSVTVYYESSARNGMNKSQKTDILCDFDENYPLFTKNDYKKVVQRYLSEKNAEKNENIAERIHAPKVIYVDSSRIVFAAKKTDMPLASGCEYALLLCFPITGPIKQRKVYVSCVVDDMFESYERDKLCACAKISSIREEDVRFLDDKMQQ